MDLERGLKLGGVKPERAGVSRRTFLVAGAAAGGGCCLASICPSASLLKPRWRARMFLVRMPSFAFARTTAWRSSCRKSRWDKALTPRCPCSLPKSLKSISRK